MFYRPLPVLASLSVSLCRFLYRLCVFKSISFLRLVSLVFVIFAGGRIASARLGGPRTSRRRW